MNIDRSCRVKDLNWGALPELETRLKRLGMVMESASVDLHRFPDSITYDLLDQAYRDVQQHGHPHHFVITVHGRSPKGEFVLRIHRVRNIHMQELLSVGVEGIEEPTVMDEITEFLGLEPDEPVTLPQHAARTAFIAHRFDATGTDCADKLARFLELLGFAVVTGRGYAPKSVATKVRARIEQQAVIFVILTPGPDDTWLIQESVLADVKGKPLILIKDKSCDFRSGLLADYEFIPFSMPHIETIFTPVLEGLRELGYMDLLKD